MNIQDLDMTPEAEQPDTSLTADEPMELEAVPEDDSIEVQEDVEDNEKAEVEEEQPEESPATGADAKRTTFRKFVETQNLMRATNRLLGQQSALADALRARGRILSLLNLKDGVSSDDMAQILGISRGTLKEALAKLAESGYVICEAIEDEKQAVLVSITEAGKTAQIPETLPDCLFGGFEDAELEALGDYLARISANLKTELGEEALKAIEEQRATQKAPFEKGDRGGRGHDDRGFRGRDDRGGRGRDDRGGFRGGRDDRGGRGGRDDRGFRGRDDRGGRGRDDRGGFRSGRDDRGGRGRDDFRGRDDRGGRGGFRGRDDRGGRGDRW